MFKSMMGEYGNDESDIGGGFKITNLWVNMAMMRVILVVFSKLPILGLGRVNSI